jgi:hypothetical protein
MAYRETGWHRESGGVLSGGHITVDFENRAGKHVTTHHVYKMNAAYRKRRNTDYRA